MKIGIITDPHLGFSLKKEKSFNDFVSDLSSKIDLLVISGDLGTSNPYESELCLKILRKHNPKLPILCVMGNHDFFSNTYDFTSLTQIMNFHKKMCSENNVHHLEFDGEFIVNDISFLGYMGWYAGRNNDTKDYAMIPKQNSYGADTFSVMKKMESDALDRIADTELTSRKKVCVTHFNLLPDRGFENLSGNPRFFDMFLKEKFDLVIMGHSHQKMDKVIDGCRVINAGADYQKSPEDYFIVIDL